LEALTEIEMRVRCEGWKHDDKNHKLVNCDISHTKPGARWPRYRDEVCIDQDGSDVIISAGIEKLSLTGNFSISVKLSKEEIINLARNCFGSRAFRRSGRGTNWQEVIRPLVLLIANC
jgi:hypothetical protein